jgi:protein-disulfide isomerase
MHRKVGYLFIVLLLALLANAQQAPSTATAKVKPGATAASQTPAKTAAKSATTASPPSEDTVNAFMQQMFGYDSSLTWKVIDIKPSRAEGLVEVTVLVSNPKGQQSNKLYITADGQHAVIGDIIPFGVHPFNAAGKELDQRCNGPTRGPADAAVTIVEFSDLQCPHCKEAQPTIDKLIAEEKNARLVFQGFPLPSHDWAAKAAAYADCVSRSSSDAFWKFTQSVYDAQTDITLANADEKLTGLADKAGAKGADVAACAAKPETTDRVQHSIALGTSVDVTGTPTLFINGRKIANVNGIPYDVLKSLVEFAAKEGK